MVSLSGFPEARGKLGERGRMQNFRPFLKKIRCFLNMTGLTFPGLRLGGKGLTPYCHIAIIQLYAACLCYFEVIDEMSQPVDKSMESGAPSVDDGGYSAMREKIKGSNIDETTLLATDYLNHFNEIVMLLEMIPDMPDMLDEIKEWQPKSYRDHFRDSTIAEKDLAIEAYDFVPAIYREPFEQTVEQIDSMIASTVQRLEKNIADGDTDVLRANVQNLSRLIQRLMDMASAIMHGSAKTMDQSEIDILLGD